MSMPDIHTPRMQHKVLLRDSLAGPSFCNATIVVLPQHCTRGGHYWRSIRNHTGTGPSHHLTHSCFAGILVSPCVHQPRSSHHYFRVCSYISCLPCLSFFKVLFYFIFDIFLLLFKYSCLHFPPPPTLVPTPLWLCPCVLCIIFSCD